jgi:HSP20 family protein
MQLRIGSVPLSTLHVMQRNMDRWFDTAFSRALGEEASDSVAAFAPPVDIRETAESLEFFVELPGFEKDQIDIRVDQGTLILAGERKWDNEAKSENFHRVERSYGRFHRSFAIPPSVDASRITANLKNGVLHLVLPKSERAKPQQIPVNAS